MKNIEKLSNQKEIVEEIKEQNQRFSVKDFYLNDGDGAVAIFTPRQTIYNYSKIEHGDVVEKIYDHIYPDFKKFDIEKYGTWQQESLEMGNIVIQLCSGCSTVVWVPKEINEQQFQSLTQFKNEVKEANILLEQQGKKAIEFDCNLEDEKDIDHILELSKHNINNNLYVNHKEKYIKHQRINQRKKGKIGKSELKEIAENGKNERIGAKEFIQSKIKNLIKGER